MKPTKETLPAIAVVTEIGNEPPFFQSIQNFCEELHQLASKKGYLFYVFSFINFHATHVKGYCYEDLQWKKATFPLPHVIYNRIHSRKTENSDEFRHWKKHVDQLAIPLFNDRFLSKWEVHELVCNNKQLTSHIPETRIFTILQLRKMVLLHPIVFLKPIHGSKGKNIIRVSRKSEDWFVDFSDRTDVPFVFASLTELLSFIEKQIGNRPYLIQQGISLICFENRPLDFRVLCHGHSQNTWQVTSIVARATSKQQFVSNISLGGELLQPLTALTAYFDHDHPQQYLSKLKSLSIDIASALHSSFDGYLGELGIDMGIDTKGHLWLIEVNSKPSKDISNQSLKIRPSAKAIIDVCIQLINATTNIKK
jgi:hypothetical protein